MKVVLVYLVALIVICAETRSFNSPKIHTFRKNYITDFTPSKTNQSGHSRIYGGHFAPEGRFKFMIFMMYAPYEDFYKGVYSCSASLISPEWVLLAGHCFNENMSPKASSVILVGGKADLSGYIEDRAQLKFTDKIDESKYRLQERRASAIYVNPNYNVSTKDHDVALIRLKEEFKIGYTLETIEYSKDQMKSRKSCTILGWGLSEGEVRSYKLMYANGIEAQTVEEGCQHKTPDQGEFICLIKPEDKGKGGICQGDSGSPLICENKIWGVASHLVSYEAAPICGRDFEEYYSKLHPELTWIEDTMKKGTGTGSRMEHTVFSVIIIGVLVHIFSEGRANAQVKFR